MTDEEHELWEALAVGHAMRALEPADDAQFRAHLADCARCEEVLRQSEALVASLAMAAEPITPPASLRERIVAMTDDTGARVAPVVDELSRRRAPRASPALRMVAAAAVIGAAIGGGVTYVVAGDGGSTPGAPPAAMSCLLDPACLRLPLKGDDGVIGAVLVAAGQVSLVTPKLATNNSEEMYVLWKGDKTGKMTAIAGFRLTGASKYSLIGPAPDMTGVTAMAISREERTTSLPEKPSAALATAEVPQAT